MVKVAHLMAGEKEKKKERLGTSDSPQGPTPFKKVPPPKLPSSPNSP
jgi:hypothetical protein